MQTFRKGALWILSLVLLAACIGLAYISHKLYFQLQALKLQPLQLATYSQAPKKQTQPRVVFFGDSRALSWSSPDMPEVEFLNRGIGQQTSNQIRARLSHHVLPLQADIVVAQLCINDLKMIPLFPQQKDQIIQNCQQNIDYIVETLTAYQVHVILTTIFPLGEIPIERHVLGDQGVSEAVLAVNEHIKSLANEQVSIFDSYQQLLDKDHKIQPAFSRDWLHLTPTGYQHLNQALETLIKQISDT